MGRFHFSETDFYFSYNYDEKPSQSRFYMHTHVYTEVYIFLSGNAVFHVEGTAYALKPGDVLVMRPGEAHYVEVDTQTPYRRACINFDINIFHSLDPERTLTRVVFNRDAGKQNRYQMGQYGIDTAERLTEQGTRMHILGNLVLLLQAINERFDLDQEQINTHDTLEYKLIRYINNHLEYRLSLQDLCDRFFISRTQLCRLFKQATGTSVGSYITGKRLLSAREYLLQGRKPTEVYRACGYQDYSTFFRAYVNFFGHSPRDAEQFRNAITPDTDIILR